MTASHEIVLKDGEWIFFSEIDIISASYLITRNMIQIACLLIDEDVW